MCVPEPILITDPVIWEVNRQIDPLLQDREWRYFCWLDLNGTTDFRSVDEWEGDGVNKDYNLPY